MLFRPEPVLRRVCECAGATWKGSGFRYRDSSAKGEIGVHKGGSGLLQAVLKYGNQTKRDGVLLNSFEEDYVRSNLDRDLIQLFHYKIP